MLPYRYNFSQHECRGHLRRLELESYSTMLNALRAQGALNDVKIKFLSELRDLLHISYDRHQAEVRRVANDELLGTVADILTNKNTANEWNKEGRRTFPFLPRTAALTAFSIAADNAQQYANEQNMQLDDVKEMDQKNVENIFTEDTATVNNVVTKDPAKAIMFEKPEVKKPRKWSPRTKNNRTTAYHQNVQAPINKKIQQLYLRHTKAARATTVNRKMYTKRGTGATGRVIKATASTQKQQQQQQQQQQQLISVAKVKESPKKLPAANKQITPKPVRKGRKTKNKPGPKRGSRKNVASKQFTDDSDHINSSQPMNELNEESIENNNPVVKIIYSSPVLDSKSIAPSAIDIDNNCQYETSNLITESTPVITLYPESDNNIMDMDSAIESPDTKQNNVIILNPSFTNEFLAHADVQSKTFITVPSADTINSTISMNQSVDLNISPVTTATTTTMASSPTPLPLPPSPSIITTTATTTTTTPLMSNLTESSKLHKTKSIVIGKTIVNAPTKLGRITLSPGSLVQNNGNLRIIKSMGGKVILQKANDEFKSINLSKANIIKTGLTKQITLKNVPMIGTTTTTITTTTKPSNMIVMPKRMISIPTTSVMAAVAPPPTTTTSHISPPPPQQQNAIYMKNIQQTKQPPNAVVVVAAAAAAAATVATSAGSSMIPKTSIISSAKKIEIIDQKILSKADEYHPILVNEFNKNGENYQIQFEKSINNIKCIPAAAATITTTNANAAVSIENEIGTNSTQMDKVDDAEYIDDAFIMHTDDNDKNINSDSSKIDEIYSEENIESTDELIEEDECLTKDETIVYATVDYVMDETDE